MTGTCEDGFLPADLLRSRLRTTPSSFTGRRGFPPPSPQGRSQVPKPGPGTTGPYLPAGSSCQGTERWVTLHELPAAASHRGQPRAGSAARPVPSATGQLGWGIQLQNMCLHLRSPPSSPGQPGTAMPQKAAQDSARPGRWWELRSPSPLRAGELVAGPSPAGAPPERKKVS